MSRSMPKDDKAECAVGQTREPGEEEETDRQEVVIVDNQPTNEVVVVVVDDDDAEEVDCCDSADCLLVGDLDQPKESQCTDRRDKETCAEGQRGEPVVEGKEGDKQEVVIVEKLPSNEVAFVVDDDDNCDDDYDGDDDDDDDDDDEEEAGAVFIIGQSLLETGLRKNQKIFYDLWSLAVGGQQTAAQVTIEGRRFTVLKVHPDIDVDVVFYSTTEGGYRGYAALVSQAEHELFLWHVVEIVRVNKDGSVKFPDKVKVPTLSLTSLIKFGGYAETSNNEDTPLCADCNDRRFANAIVKRVKEAEGHGRKQKMEKEEEGQPPNSKKRKVEMLVLD